MHRLIKQLKPRSIHSSLEDNQASSGQDPFTGFFAGSNISKIEGCTINFSFNTAPCSSGESSARSKPRKRHIIISDDSVSDKLELPFEKLVSQIQGRFKHVLSRLEK